MQSEKITYLVTNFNNGQYVGECLRSIVDQKKPDWLCLVIDDASTDNSVEVIKEYESEKLKLVQNEKNIDQVRSLQKLIEMSVTDIVAIVDSDDALESDATEHVLNAFSKSSRIGFVYTNCIEYDENLKKPLAIGLSKKIPFGPTSSIVNGHPGHLRAFRKSVYYKTSGYNTDLLYAEDLDLGYKLEEVCLPYFVNLYLYKHRRITDTRGRKLQNKLKGYKNRMIAKNHAIERRRIKGALLIIIRAYVFFEYKKCISSKLNYKLRKYMHKNFMSWCKYMINKSAFKKIKIEKS
jgi:glycosyltransferase involved in cell wall biosynthesis